MIGFDRPLRPSWIYETLKTVKVGTAISDYYTVFENIAKELTGKEGKRKVRTVLFRSFIYSMQQDKNRVENSILLNWTHKYSNKTLNPLLFAKLLMDYDVLRFASSKIAAYVDNKGHLNTSHFMNKFIQEYGDRDVVHRSLRSFFTTLEYFNLANKLSLSEIVLLDKFQLTNEQTKMFLLLYSECFLKSRMLDLKELNSSIMMHYADMPVQSTAREYNGVEWEYIREPSRNILLMK